MPISKEQVQELVSQSSVALEITGLVDPYTPWFRDVPPGDSRYGPWETAQYLVKNNALWEKKGPCIYFVVASDYGIRYVGESGNRFKDRWRDANAYTQTGRPFGKRLFHSQCWKYLQEEIRYHKSERFTVHPVFTVDLRLSQLSHPISGVALSLIAADDNTWKMLVKIIEKDIRCSRDPTYLQWNVR